MPVADTSFIVDLLRNDRRALKLLHELEQEGKPLAVTPVNVLELFDGAYRSLRVEENVRDILALLSAFEEIPFSGEVYHAFGYLSATLHSQGNPVGDFDQVIAAAALCYDGEIVTRDWHFGKIADLTVISW